MSSNNKPKIIIQRKTITIFCCVFLAATLIFTGVRVWANNFFNSRVFSGDTNNGDETETEMSSEEIAVSLLKDMTPIALDEGSSFYELFQSQKRVNVLCLGVNDGMTDTIMLASYDMENQRVDLISIPRDTYYYRGAGFKDFANHKINAIYSSQGVVKLAEVVSEILYGMPIHYYAIAEYDDACKCWHEFSGHDLMLVLDGRPELVSRMDLSSLTGEDWHHLLFAHPEVSEQVQVPWDKLSGSDWGYLIEYRPQFAPHCDWHKIPPRNWSRILYDHPEFADKCDWGKMTMEDLRFPLEKHRCLEKYVDFVAAKTQS